MGERTHTATLARFLERYEVTEDGRVFSLTKWRGRGRAEMQQEPNGDGYPSVRLTVNGRRTRIATHRLVAQMFLPPRPSPSHQVRHLDGDKSNRSARNLAWGTAKENADDRERHGRTSRGESHGNAIRAGNLELARAAEGTRNG